MNTSKIKSYAIQARRDFLKAVTERANAYGIFSDDHIEAIDFQGDMAIIGERAFPKKEGELREKLVGRVKRDGFTMVMRSCAYTWFNRFVALRYMEVHSYLEHGYRVLSNNGGSVIPEILEHAADIEFHGIDKDKIIELKLAGTKDNELYRLLILAQCDDLHKSMPFLYDRIDNETELLLPDNLLHSDSPIRKMVTEIDEFDWEDVEIIGWIYQFYISERKDEVIGKVVKSEDIPAATQLFTPSWIVKYMVQNTLGRMWLATYPDSPLKDKMEYYIEPAEQEPGVQAKLDATTPKELNPEQITFLDPACGSGHILVAAYDLFKEIYLERGYRTRDIPSLVLANNLFGLDICDRAAQLACFAVLMKSREDDRRILDREELKFNVMAIQESKTSDERNIELFFKGDEYQTIRNDLNEIVSVFEKGKTFGSLITVPVHLAHKMENIGKVVDEKIGKWILQSDVQNLAALAKQAQILSLKYACVVTNPPYMGGKALNSTLKSFAIDRFPCSKSDLFAMFIERGFYMIAEHGYNAMVTMQSWMFLSSYEKFRERLLKEYTISCMVHMANMVMRIAFGTAATVWQNQKMPAFKGSFSYVHYEDLTEEDRPKQFPIQNDRLATAASAYFKKIPGSPIAYWFGKAGFSVFQNAPLLENIAAVKTGMTTADNARFVRFWNEVSIDKVGLKKILNSSKAEQSNKKWFPYNKGGGFRRWYGFNENVINWEFDGKEIKENVDEKGKRRASVRAEEYYFNPSITYSAVTSGKFSARVSDSGFLFDSGGSSVFCKTEADLKIIGGVLCSALPEYFLSAYNDTINFQPGDIGRIPIVNMDYSARLGIVSTVNSCIEMSRADWDAYETSWDFTRLPLLQIDYRQPTLWATYQKLRNHWRNMTLEMQHLEEKNNRSFIKAYNLQDELNPKVPLSEITLTCNPHYRYKGNKNEDEIESLMLTNTIKELISYAMGCTMGRYSFDHPGLIYAHSGNIEFDPAKYKTFPADDDGIIPIMDMDWFPDDATNRFINFIKVNWSPEHLDENLKFIADSLKSKRNETPTETIRGYLSTTFFKDHLKTYKKRPIYWLFSSGKERAFECLVYLHRYNESTLSRMRGTYVTPLQSNISSRLEFLQGEKDSAPTTSAKNKIQKEIDKLKKKQIELSNFDDELRHYADMKISLDLDDGVRFNYGKFGKLLAEKKAITGKK